MKRFKLEVTEAQLACLQTGLENLLTDLQLRSLAGRPVDSLLGPVQESLEAIADASALEWLDFPSENGEWFYREAGDKCVKSVVFVDGVDATEKGYVAADLAGDLEGQSVAKLKGSWQKVICPTC